MANLTYRVSIRLDEKGAGYTIKKTLQSQLQRQTQGPIHSVQFAGQPTGEECNIDVTVDDASLVKIISDAVARSTLSASAYSVVRVSLLQELQSTERYKDLQRQYATLQKRIEAMQHENDSLRALQQKPESNIQTPLEGLLAYFDTLDYKPTSFVDSPADLLFAKRVFSDPARNTLTHYINILTGNEYTSEEVESALTYEPLPETSIDTLKENYDIAVAELDYLQKIKDGTVFVPGSLCSSIIEQIESKQHPSTISSYEQTVAEKAKKEKLHAAFVRYREQYNNLSETLQVLSEAGSSLPTILQHLPGGIDVYFPFHLRDIKGGFKDDLAKELQTYFEAGTLKEQDHKYVSYHVEIEGNATTEGVEKLLQHIPFVLRAAGFKRLVPLIVHSK